MKRFIAVLMLAGGLLIAGGASAAVTVTIYQSGSDVVAHASGPYNVGALTSSGTETRVGEVIPSIGAVFVGSTATVRYYSGASCTGSIGTGSNALASTNTGSPLGVFTGAPYIYVLDGSTTGTASATSTWTGTTLATLGLTLGGTITCTWAGDSLTVNVGNAPSAVPTLSEWSQMLLGLLVMTLLGWHFHRQRFN